MKITFLSPAPNLSGGQRVIAIYADQMLERGHDVTVVARGHVVPTMGTKLRYIARGQQIPTPPQGTHFDRMRARLITLSHSGPITAEDVPDADVVIATWWETAFEAVHFPSSKGRKLYFVQGHEVHDHLPMHLSGASYFLPLKKITISSWLIDAMRDLYGDDDVALVPNAVDHDLFFAPERSRQSAPTVGLMYSTPPLKGVDIALCALEVARQTHRDLRVVAFGTSHPTKQMPLPEGTKLHVNPPQNSLRDIYAACDVFIAASRSEGFGLPILEAMACRTPVVATRTGCAEDVIDDDKNGYLVDVGDADSLGNRLAKVLSMDAVSWRTMSKAAHQKALEYAWEDSANIFEKVLLSFVKSDFNN